MQLSALHRLQRIARSTPRSSSARNHWSCRAASMSHLAIVVIILLVVLAGGGFDGRNTWYANPNYRYGGGFIALLLIVLLVLLLTGSL